MAFFAKNFSFDGVPSEAYGLQISNMSTGDDYSSGGSNVDIITQRIFRRSVPYFYGASSNEPLTFQCAVTREEELTSDESRAVYRWLFGYSQYKKLQVRQNDMQQLYFNCFLTSPDTIRIGNRIHGFSFTVTCDAPFGWEFPKTLTKTYAVELAAENFTFQNTSDSNDYLYPELTITVNGFGGDFTLVNTSDSSRSFELTGLTAGEILTVDNDRGILTSDTGLLRMPNFNKSWFRLVPGRNDLQLSGNISSMAMVYHLARKAA